ncbi:MAG: transaldolase family protein [Lawsonibacter sp.]
MSEFKGKLHETVVKFPCTDIWMDSCGEEELNYGLERGITGATSNPIIVGAVVKNELSYWEPTIKKLITDNSAATEDEIAWLLIDAVGRERSQKLLSVFEHFHGKKGRLSIQTNAKYYRCTEKMVEQAIHLNSLGRNMQVKMPASAAGVRAMEEATYRGISINATVSFTVAQAVAVAEAVERGLARRRAEGLPCEEMAPVCTIMIGRTDDWMKDWVKASGAVVSPEILEWAGVAVIKEAYRIYRERGYTTRLLSAANRNYYHWAQLIGGDLCQTINYGWQKRLNGCDVPVESRIGEPVPAAYLAELNQFEEFHKSFHEKGMTPEQFETYGGFRSTLTTFLGGYDDLVKLVRGYMI